MTTDAERREMAALVTLHAEVLRQGPGDMAVLDRMLDRLRVAEGAQAADFGCGVGAAALHLAETRGARVLALDAAADFIARLTARLAAQPPVQGSVAPMRGDMAAPPVEPGTLDVIVSEGAAYAVGFETALRVWRPLVRRGGGLVVSECVWFGTERPTDAAAFWTQAYPGMGSVADAVARAEAAGWRLVAAERLPAAAWWESYYHPLAARITALAPTADRTLARIIAEAQAEMALFRATCAHWGYVYLALDAA